MDNRSVPERVPAMVGPRGQSVSSADGDPPYHGESDDPRSPCFLSPEDRVLGFIAGFALAHKGHDWLILSADDYRCTLWCNSCLVSRTYDL